MRQPPLAATVRPSATRWPAQCLETLAVTFMTGRVAAADLAPLEGLRRLRALTLSASSAQEEAGEYCLQAFPDSLLRLRGLTSLGVSSMGACVWGRTWCMQEVGLGRRDAAEQSAAAASTCACPAASSCACQMLAARPKA